MENYCKHCGNPTREDQELCTACYGQIPAIFTCVDCGETCYRKEGAFGSMIIPEGEEEDIEYCCAECTEIAHEECRVDLGALGDSIDDFFGEDYFEDQL